MYFDLCCNDIAHKRKLTIKWWDYIIHFLVNKYLILSLRTLQKLTFTMTFAHNYALNA